MNEYMAVENAGAVRLATFPDVITTLSPEGEPLSVGQLQVGMKIFVLHVPKTVIPLASSVLIRGLIRRSKRPWGLNWRAMLCPAGYKESEPCRATPVSRN